MSQNIGTLITSTIRPNDSQDPIASVYSNEAKGGHHVYQSISERDSLISARRDFGMLVTIYNDGTSSNNKTYQLKYGYSSFTASDNNNWIPYVVSSNSEWLDSVIARTSSIPLTYINGDRYLISGTPSGTSSVLASALWNGHVDNIAQYDSVASIWAFTLPAEGMTVRVDNENGIFYKYTGIYASGGSWNKEYYNQVYFITATSSNGYDFTAESTLTSYTKPSVFYANFGTSSSGPSASININGLGKVKIKKISGNNLQEIGSGDLSPSIEYQLLYDGTYFQIPLSTAVTTIGTPDDGTYDDGLYDFTSNTTIANAVDSFNQLFKALVPPSAPSLAYMSGTSSLVGASIYPAKLSYTSSQMPTVAANTIYPASNSPYGAVNADGTWAISATSDGGIYRLGIYSTYLGGPFNVNLFGRLNYNVATNSGTPTPAYSQYSFGDANVGMLYMYINGLTISSISLTNSYAAINDTSSFTKPGLSVSSATSSKFPGGSVFELFYNRTGTWQIPSTCLAGPFALTSSIGMTANAYGIVRGYNYVTVNHYKNATNNYVSRVEFIIDDSVSVANIAVTNNNYPNFSSAVGGTTKQLSGITYYTSMTLNYSAAINNAYYTVYSSASDAVGFTENYSAGTGISSAASIITTTNQALPSVATVIANPGTYNNLASLTFPTQTYNVGSSKRRILDTISMYISSVKHPTNAISFTIFANTIASAASVLLDTFAVSSTLNAVSQSEPFDDEQYRLKTLNTYDSIATVTTNTWDSSQTLTSDTGLQVYNGRLYYPTINFSSGSSTNTNPCYGSASCNYSGLTGQKTYYRKFYLNPSTLTSKAFIITLLGSATLIPYATAFSTTTQMKIAIKLPGVTGWADILTAYSNDAALAAAEGGGCYSGSVPTSVSITGSTIPIALSTGGLGTQVTGGSSGYVVLRITTNSAWAGYLDSLTFVYN